ncbi:phosphoserine phosphatase SerB [Sesbania bispinosa]|nr:phosphoserine phosphatase SerB [Sesbania bispinosa]
MGDQAVTNANLVDLIESIKVADFPLFTGRQRNEPDLGEDLENHGQLGDALTIDTQNHGIINSFNMQDGGVSHNLTIARDDLTDACGLDSVAAQLVVSSIPCEASEAAYLECATKATQLDKASEAALEYDTDACGIDSAAAQHGLLVEEDAVSFPCSLDCAIDVQHAAQLNVQQGPVLGIDVDSSPCGLECVNEVAQLCVVQVHGARADGTGLKQDAELDQLDGDPDQKVTTLNEGDTAPYIVQL